ncbi:site-specific integrase [Opitutaceae bacterium TAV4]|nr:site-specific integrase [Opitutaceae bacterium TAV4]RRK02015.1 site-specific integrase [Opitutaceae bacterium TAV3]
MASLRKKERSPFWFACFYAPDGRRRQVSTKQTNRKTAQAVADKFEKAAKLASQKRLGETQARKVIGEIYESVSGERLASATVQDYLTRWTEGRKADTSSRTAAAYAQVVRDFLASLGSRSSLDISQVSKADVAAYRDSVLARTSISSANKALKYLRVALGTARKDGFMQDNPAANLDTLRRPPAERTARRAFTVPEVQRILANASEEWRGMILFGLYTGQRLGDIARLSWRNIDTERGELRLVTAKTGQRIAIPLATPLLAYLAKMDAGDDSAASLFPVARALIDRMDGKVSGLSKQFHDLLAEAGLMPSQVAPAPGQRTRRKAGKGKGRDGRSGPRTVNAISFHSLRHTATSLLKTAGVSAVVAMDIVGHKTEAVSQHYTHVDEDAKRKAIATLPDVLAI